MSDSKVSGTCAPYSGRKSEATSEDGTIFDGHSNANPDILRFYPNPYNIYGFTKLDKNCDLTTINELKLRGEMAKLSECTEKGPLSESILGKYEYREGKKRRLNDLIEDEFGLDDMTEFLTRLHIDVKTDGTVAQKQPIIAKDINKKELPPTKEYQKSLEMGRQFKECGQWRPLPAKAKQIYTGMAPDFRKYNIFYMQSKSKSKYSYEERSGTTEMNAISMKGMQPQFAERSLINKKYPSRLSVKERLGIPRMVPAPRKIKHPEIKTCGHIDVNSLKKLSPEERMKLRRLKFGQYLTPAADKHCTIKYP